MLAKILSKLSGNRKRIRTIFHASYERDFHDSDSFLSLSLSLSLSSSSPKSLLSHDENCFLAVEKDGMIMRLIVCVISMLVFRASAISEYK